MILNSDSEIPCPSLRPRSNPPEWQDRSGGVGSRRRTIRLLLAVSGALLLGHLVVRISAANAMLEIGPEPAALLSRHPGIFLDRARAELELSGETREETRQAAFEAFQSDPLSEIPLLVAADEAIARGEAARADRLIAAAVRRNARSRYALLLQLDRAVRAGRPREAVTTMAVLSRLFPAVSDALISELARMAAAPDTRQAVRRVMETDPPIRTQVLEQLAREGTDPLIVLGLAGAPQAGASARETPRWQQLLLDGMIMRGDIARGRQIWRRLGGGAPPAYATMVYDPGFVGLPGPPPFNWNLEAGADGVAERLRNGGGLHVEYYGRRDMRLASQLLVIPAGQYQLAMRAEGAAESAQGRLSWSLSCHPSGRGLVAIPMTGLNQQVRQISAGFHVPASGCSSQWLRLSGTATEFSRGQQITVRQLRIDRPRPR